MNGWHETYIDGLALIPDEPELSRTLRLPGHAAPHGGPGAGLLLGRGPPLLDGHQAWLDQVQAVEEAGNLGVVAVALGFPG
jgi:hypothetical protein